MSPSSAQRRRSTLALSVIHVPHCLVEHVSRLACIASAYTNTWIIAKLLTHCLSRSFGQPCHISVNALAPPLCATSADNIYSPAGKMESAPYSRSAFVPTMIVVGMSFLFSAVSSVDGA